ncbi:MAG: hypothetical protein ACREBR_04835 [bacterium]
MNRQYEVYVNGALARRHLTLAGAEKTFAKFPMAKAQIFKVIPTVDILLIKEQLPTTGSR